MFTSKVVLYELTLDSMYWHDFLMPILVPPLPQSVTRSSIKIFLILQIWTLRKIQIKLSCNQSITLAWKNWCIISTSNTRNQTIITIGKSRTKFKVILMVKRIAKMHLMFNYSHKMHNYLTNTIIYCSCQLLPTHYEKTVRPEWVETLWICSICVLLDASRAKQINSICEYKYKLFLSNPYI